MKGKQSGMMPAGNVSSAELGASWWHLEVVSQGARVPGSRVATSHEAQRLAPAQRTVAYDAGCPIAAAAAVAVQSLLSLRPLLALQAQGGLLVLML